MSDIFDRVKAQEEMQRNQSFADAFSRIVSGGKPGYKAVIETKKIIPKCSSCGTILDEKQKFCHECGAKVEKPVS